jgi:protein-tyrosine phosphatase
MAAKKRVLFVCLGNICRSPAAQAVFQSMVVGENLESFIEVDSAGTGDWHVGELPDPRMRKHGEARGYDLCSLARSLAIKDFDQDYVIAMDKSNLRNIEAFASAKGRKFSGIVKLLCEFGTDPSICEVPDPYYGGDEGFALVLDLLEDACVGLLNQLKQDLAHVKS